MAKIVAVVGSTGVGKTSLVKALSGISGFSTGLEQHAERPFQEKFNSDKKYALANQVDYLMLRAEQELELRTSPGIALVDGGLEQDFHGFTRLFLTRGYLSQPEFDLCSRLYSLIRTRLPFPELIVYLSAPPPVIEARLTKRSRINIATGADVGLLTRYLDEWALSQDPEHLIRLDVSSEDPAYRNLAPSIVEEIHRRLD